MSTMELLLADGRFPGGGFAHSGGLEAAVGEGAVRTLADLEAFVAGRLTSAGRVEAWLAARACALGSAAGAELDSLEAEAEAHQPSPALRAAARAQGRGLRRAAAVIWPELDGGAVEVHPVVLGVVCRAAGLDSPAAARVAVHGVAMAVVSAAPKLLPIDMADAIAIEARLAGLADRVAVCAAESPICPVSAAPALELRAERHAEWEVRLFAS